MRIAKAAIKNYRSFLDATFQFEPGVTVLIGENNSGKTTLLKALALVLQRAGRERPTTDDFSRRLECSEDPPEIQIALTFRSSDTDSNEDRLC